MFEGLFQPMHLLVLMFVALLVFGPKKVADLGKGLGEGIKGFKEAIKEQPTVSQQTTPQISSNSAASEAHVPERSAQG
jgi:sec-independent protein translocase protein TatA